MSDLSPFEFFQIVADAAIEAHEAVLRRVLALRGIRRHLWPKPWPLIAYNPHGTLDPVHLAACFGLVSQDPTGPQKFLAGWHAWLDRCADPLITHEEIDAKCRPCLNGGANEPA